MRIVNVIVFVNNNSARAEGRSPPSSIKPLRGPEPRRLGQRAADSLRHAILAGELGAGTRLAEDKLASRLRVSRGPVRDALLQLAEEGLVSIAGRGALVASANLRDLWELYSLRGALECLAVEQFTKNDSSTAGQPIGGHARRGARGSARGLRCSRPGDSWALL